MPGIVCVDDDTRLLTPPGVVLDPRPREIHKAIKLIGVFALFPKSEFDADYGCFAFKCTGTVFGSDESRIPPFSYLWSPAKLRMVPAFEWVNNRRTMTGAYHVVDQYAEIRGFVCTWSFISTVAGAQHQFGG